MDTKIALAIMSKIEKIYEDNNFFVSFPLSPLTFTTDELKIVTSKYALSDGQQVLATFSKLVNQCPNGKIWNYNENGGLSQNYKDILEGSIKLASPSYTDEEEKILKEAMCVLHNEGTADKTVKYLKYMEYEKEFRVINEKLRSNKATIEFLKGKNDSEIALQIYQLDSQNIDFQKEIEDLEREWIIFGYKSEIEAAKIKIDSLRNNAPELLWYEWKKKFNPDIDIISTDFGEIGISGFSPSNFMEVASWQTFNLAGDEIKDLIDKAPIELKARLAPNATDIKVKNLSFEYVKVDVHRPWFEPKIFVSEFWNFLDSEKILCDGSNPPQGSMTSYVTSVILSRNVKIELDEPLKKDIQQISLGFLNVMPLPQSNFMTPILTKKSRFVSEAVIQPLKWQKIIERLDVKASTETRRKLSNLKIDLKETLPPMKILEVKPVIGVVKAKPAFHLYEAKPEPVILKAHSGIGEMKIIYPEKKLKFYKRKPDPIKLEPITPVEPIKTKPEEKIDTDVFVLGVVCKKLGKVPNPSTKLEWE